MCPRDLDRSDEWSWSPVVLHEDHIEWCTIFLSKENELHIIYSLHDVVQHIITSIIDGFVEIIQ
jgi:hypothetical protein